MLSNNTMDSILDDIISGSNQPREGFVLFDSSDHVRFENNVPVTGHNYNCHRQIKIEKNIKGGEGYTVTIFNLDGVHPLWRDNVQMAPKRMRIESVVGNIIEMRGFGEDTFGNSFADYGISIKIEDGAITVVQLNMFDRFTSIVYLP